jgi:hypothetical protein
VRNAARQLTDSLHLLRLEQCRPGLLENPVRFRPLRDVAGDLRKPSKHSILVADCVDHDLRPETATLFPDPPSFRFKPAVPRSSGQPALRESCRSVFRRVKTREMRSDDFLCSVALDAPCAGVPVCDHSVPRPDRDSLKIRHISI